MAVLFDGKAFAENKRQNIADSVNTLISKEITPTLASIYYAHDAGSSLYTRLKKEAAESVGIKFIEYKVEEKSADEFIATVEKLNNDENVHGILVQKPSGDNDFTTDEWIGIVSALSPKKDVDGLAPENLGLLSIGKPRVVPATVKAVVNILDYWEMELKGKHFVIIGASEILGKPLSMLMTDRGATVSVLHKATKDLARYTLDADILVSATGVAGLITGEMVKEGCAVVDVGSPKGDVNYNISQKAGYFSPVPGGVGPVTIACLLENLLEVCDPVKKMQ